MPLSTYNQIVNIKAIYIKTNEVVFVYKQMDVLLQHMTGVLQGQLLMTFLDRCNLLRGKCSCRLGYNFAHAHTHGQVGGKRSTLHTWNTSSGPWRA